ncbi:MAG: hypothetical protein ACRDF0_01795 [Candidatus Limnocylindria bacterium]
MLQRLRHALPGRRTRLWLSLLAASALATSALAGGAVAAVAALGCAAAACAAAILLIRDDDRPRLIVWILAVTLVRVTFAAVLHLVLIQRGPYGALFLDDAGYVQIAIALADHWRGRGLAPFIDPSFDHNYVKLAAALFYVIGPNIVALKLLNTLLGVLAALFVYRTMTAAGLPGRRVGLALMLIFPSIVLWSALALKDSYSLLFMLLTVWSVTEFVRTHRYLPWCALAIVALLALENVRAFLFAILVVAWPIGVLVALPRRRIAATAVTTVLAVLLLVATSALSYLNPSIITASVYVRQSMARGAASGFVAPLPVIRAEACVPFVVTVPGRTPVPDPPRRIDVPVGTELVVDPGATARPGSLLVRPGDVVAVAGATPCPVAARATSLPAVVLAPDARNVVSTPAPTTQDAFAFSRDLAETAAHLPVGVLALVAAPFPLIARTPGELAAAPEMLAWYGILLFAFLGLRRLTPQMRARFAYGLVVLALIALVLSLYEGNVGTLVRHRAMVIPFVIVLAAVGAAARRDSGATP